MVTDVAADDGAVTDAFSRLVIMKFMKTRTQFTDTNQAIKSAILHQCRIEAGLYQDVVPVVGSVLIINQ
jgi:hypothetical protein